MLQAQYSSAEIAAWHCMEISRLAFRQEATWHNVLGNARINSTRHSSDAPLEATAPREKGRKMRWLSRHWHQVTSTFILVFISSCAHSPVTPPAISYGHSLALEAGAIDTATLDVDARMTEQTLAQAGCKEQPEGLLVARACGLTMSRLTCAVAPKSAIGCCAAACGLRILEMESAVVEVAAQECAARVRLAPTIVNPACEFRLPASSMKYETLQSACLERCQHLVNAPTVARGATAGPVPSVSP